MRSLRPATQTEFHDFPSALSWAIEASELTLERIVDHLAEQGLPLSIATLSYWRRGRSRPERPESIRAVRALEGLLQLPEGALILLLGPRRYRGRRPLSVQEPIIDGGKLWGFDRADGAEAFARLEPAAAERLTQLSVHDDLFLDAEGRESRLRCRMIVRADVNGVDRLQITHRADPTDRDAPRVTAVTHGRLDHARTHQDGGYLRAEILFDRILAAGETAVVEYEVTPEAQDPSSGSERRFNRGTPQYVLHVNFDRGAVPLRCIEIHRDGLALEQATEHELWIGNTGGAHVAALDVRPGVIGMRWNWS